MQLTKEQIDGIEQHVKEFDELWPYQADDMLELLRGYRRYIEAVEHHKAEIETHAFNVQHWTNKHNPVLASISQGKLDYHRSRLTALQKGQD